MAVRSGAIESDKLDRSTTEEPARHMQSLGYAAKSAPTTGEAARGPAAAAPPETALAEAPTDASMPPSSVAVVIQTQHKAGYLSNAAVLASWGGDAGAPPVAADQPVEQVYQLQAPELAYRLNQILAANPRGQVEVQQGRAAEDNPVVAQVAEALGAPIAGMPVAQMGVPAAPPVAETKGGDRGAKRGAEPAKLPQRVAGGESETLRQEIHRRHVAVTEEPDLTIVLVEPPASPPARAAAPAGKKAAPPAEQSPKEALLDQLMGLLLRGGPRGAPANNLRNRAGSPLRCASDSCPCRRRRPPLRRLRPRLRLRLRDGDPSRPSLTRPRADPPGCPTMNAPTASARSKYQTVSRRAGAAASGVKKSASTKGTT